jgi:cytochrome c
LKLTSIMAIAAALACSTGLAGADLAAGKALYDNTCKNCHGEDGSGSTTSDQFWKIKIPRLRDSYVQKQSDQQLTNVILNGKRKMPAVIAGETAHRSKVTPEQVPDVIAYVRTLKR